MSQTTPERWVEQALQSAERAVGTTSLIPMQLQVALACEALIGIFAAQERANGEHMRAAAQLLIQNAEEELSRPRARRRR